MKGVLAWFGLMMLVVGFLAWAGREGQKEQAKHNWETVDTKNGWTCTKTQINEIGVPECTQWTKVR